MTLQNHSDGPFTKKALQSIFNRYTPSFSISTNVMINTYPELFDDTNDTLQNNLSFTRYIESKIFTEFNNYYDQFDNMLLNSHLSHNNQYVWSNKQHVFITDVRFNPYNIEFVKRVNTVEDSQMDLITLVYDHINNDNIIQRISFSFQHVQQHSNPSNQFHHKLSSCNNQLKQFPHSPKIMPLKPDVINTVVLDNNDDRQHDIFHHDTKLGRYKLSNSTQNELWYVYCDTRYIDNNKVMEINIKRWNMTDYSLTWHTIQHCHNDITICINSPNLWFLRSYIYLIKNGIFHLIVKFDLNSNIIDHYLYIYPIPNYFNPSFRFKLVHDAGIKLNINNNTLSDFVVVGKIVKYGIKILAFHYDNNKLSIKIYTMDNESLTKLNEVLTSENSVECKDKSNEQFNFENCRFDAVDIGKQHIMFWIIEGNKKVKNASFIIHIPQNEWHIFCDLSNAHINGNITIQNIYAVQCPNTGHIKFAIIGMLQFHNFSRVITLIGMMYQHQYNSSLYFSKYIMPLFEMIHCKQILCTLEMYCEPI